MRQHIDSLQHDFDFARNTEESDHHHRIVGTTLQNLLKAVAYVGRIHLTIPHLMGAGPPTVHVHSHPYSIARGFSPN